MSIASEKTRIENARNRIRNHLVALGVADGTESLDEIAPIVERLGIGGAVLSDIMVTKQPAKTTYFYGDSLDLSGVEITASYGNADVTSKSVFFPQNGAQLNSVGENTVDVEYTENGVTKTKQISVTVNRKLASISVTKPSKSTYNYGETLNLAGAIVTATFTDGTSENVTSTSTFSMQTGEVLNTLGDISITATYSENGIEKTSTFAISVNKLLTSITATAPTKTEYKVGDRLDLTGVSVTANYNNGTSENVTSSVTFSPANNTVLNDVGAKTIVVSYTYNGVNKTFTISIEVKPAVPSWSSGTDAEIAAALSSHYAGEINIHDYWKVGDTRKVQLTYTPNGGIGESIFAQEVSLVLANAGGKQLATNRECAFIVIQKDCLDTLERMNYTATNVGGWKDSMRREWCNNVYINSIPSTLRGIFKSHINKTSKGNAQVTFDETQDYFALPVQYNVTGESTFSVSGEDNVHWTYYQNSNNLTKKKLNTTVPWWLRSPYKASSTDTDAFCCISVQGYCTNYSANSSYGISPFGCI